MHTSSNSKPNDYIKLANQVGWGPDHDKLDTTKTQLLDKYLIGQNILDLGCASGKYTRHIAKQFPNFNVTGVDQNPKLIGISKQAQSKAEFIVSNATKLPFKDNAFDTTIMFDLLEHLDETKAFKEIIRITKKRLILTVPRSTDPELADLFLLFGHHIDPTHQRTYTTTSATELIKKNNLTPKVIEPSHPISTDALFLNILKGPMHIKKLLRKLAFTLTTPKMFYSNLVIIADVPTTP